MRAPAGVAVPICKRCRRSNGEGEALAGAAMLALAEGDDTAAAHWLDRARAVHATPAVRALRRLMASLQSSNDKAEATYPPLIDPERAETQAGWFDPFGETEV